MSVLSHSRLLLACAAIAACSSTSTDESPEAIPGEETGADNGGADNGGTDNGGTDNGGTDNGGTDNGGTDNGGTDNGGTEPTPVEGCPPEGPFGTSTGDVIPNVTLPDCDGVLHHLHEHCARKALWIFEFAGWCEPCKPYAIGAADRYGKFQGKDFEAYIILSEKPDGSPADAAFCKTIREHYAMTMPVLYDSEGVFPRALNVGKTAVELVIGQGSILVKKGGHSGIEEAIAQELDR